jgi:hypothetical protein
MRLEIEGKRNFKLLCLHRNLTGCGSMRFETWANLTPDLPDSNLLSGLFARTFTLNVTPFALIITF